MVLLDEVSWLAHYDGAFADDLKVAWDNLFKKHDRLVMVLCGSVSSWIRDNIIDNSAFFGRRSLDIVVPELPLSDCARFWGAAASRIDSREILDVLSVTGGVPRYLAAPWRRKGAKSGRGRKGCQIDLLVQTRRTACVVEIKRRREIGREIIDETDAKIKALSLPPGVSARAALVYDGDLSPVVEADGYFDSIVPFQKLMGL